MADRPNSPGTPSVSASEPLRWNAGLPGLTWVGAGGEEAAARARDEAAAKARDDAEAKAQAERLQRIDAFRGAAEDAIKNVRDHLFQLLLIGTYLALTFAGTSDVQLLKGDVVKLPLIDVGIPILGFYLVAPGLYLLLHLNLLLQIGALGKKLRAYRDEVAATGSSEIEQAERTRLMSFPLSRAIMGGEASPAIGVLVNLYAWMAVLFLPVALLIFALVRFLPYHDAAVTWAHRAYLLADLTLAWIVLPRALSPVERTSAWWAAYGRSLLAAPLWSALFAMFARSRTYVARLPSRGAAALTGTSFAAAVFLWSATYPGEWLDRAKLEDTSTLAVVARFGGLGLGTGQTPVAMQRCKSGPCDWLTYQLFESSWTMLNRNLKLRGAILVGSESKAEDIAAVRTAARLAGHDARLRIEASLAKIGSIDLQNRDLRFADLRDAFLPKADLRGARLDGADARNAMMAFADFRPSIVRRPGDCLVDGPRSFVPVAANTDRLRFEDNEKRMTSLDVAELGHGVPGEVYCLTRAPRADFGHAYLVGGRFDLALLRGARFDHARLSDAAFAFANLQKASFEQATGRGAQFTRANLMFARFDLADMSGSSFVRARLERSSFSFATLVAADFTLARLTAADLSNGALRGATFHPSEVGAIATEEADFEYADIRRLRRSKVTVATVIDIVWLTQRDGNDAEFTLATFKELQALLDKADDFTKSTFVNAYCRGASHGIQGCNAAWTEAEYRRVQWEQAWRGLACGDAPIARTVQRLITDGALFGARSAPWRVADAKLAGVAGMIAKDLLEDACSGKSMLKPVDIRKLKAAVPQTDAVAKPR